MTRYTPCQGKCQLLGAVQMVILEGLARSGTGHRVLPPPWDPHAKGAAE